MKKGRWRKGRSLKSINPKRGWSKKVRENRKESEKLTHCNWYAHTRWDLNDVLHWIMHFVVVVFWLSRWKKNVEEKIEKYNEKTFTQQHFTINSPSFFFSSCSSLNLFFSIVHFEDNLKFRCFSFFLSFFRVLFLLFWKGGKWEREERRDINWTEF